MKIIIVPGLSSPYCDQQKPVYGPLLNETSRLFPQARAEVILLPGQSDARGHTEGEFLIPEATGQLRSVIESEKTEEHFLIARSSGCTVVAELLATWKDAPVKKVVFWGPPPFLLYYDMFASGEGPFYEKAHKTGVQITKRILINCTPWESNIAKFSQRLLIATGSKDMFSPPSYLDYVFTLESLAHRIPTVEHNTVENCPHGVTPDMPCWTDYCQCILGWLRQDIPTHTSGN